MSPGSARLVIGCVAIVAAAAAGAYVLTDRQVSSLVPAAHQPAPPAPVPPPAAVAVTTRFAPLVQSFSLLRDSAAYANASLDAPQLYPLTSGTALVSASKSTDGAWVIAMTQDGQAAYLPAADLGAYDPARAPLAAVADVPGQLRGPASVTNTATLAIGGQPVPLAGLLGKMGIFASQLQAAVNAHNPVTCVPAGAAYTCTLADGTDVGRMTLAAGLAETAPDASAEYQATEATAHAARLGLWR